MMEKYCWVAYKQVYDAPTYILHKDKLPISGGFVSTYCYDDSIKEYYLKNKRSIKGFSKTKPVCYSDTMVLDFDDCKEEAREFYKYLVEAKYCFRVYDSGGRSIHFHIKRTPKASVDLPKMDKYWVAKHAPKADPCLYSSMHLFRLPNTIHHKTGNSKILLEEVNGTNFTIDYELPSMPEVVHIDREPSDIFYNPIVTNAVWGFNNGNRDNNMFKLISTMSSYGVSRGFISDFARAVNIQSTPPLEDSRIDYMLDYHLGETNGEE